MSAVEPQPRCNAILYRKDPIDGYVPLSYPCRLPLGHDGPHDEPPGEIDLELFVLRTRESDLARDLAEYDSRHPPKGVT